MVIGSTAYSSAHLMRKAISLVRRDNTQQKGVWGMPKASGGDEGRGKRRNAVGTRWQGLIHWYPNGATHHLEEVIFPFRREGKRGELKHLSSRRKRKQVSDSVSSGERTRNSPNQPGYGLVGVVGPGIKQSNERKWSGKANHRG